MEFTGWPPGLINRGYENDEVALDVLRVAYVQSPKAVAYIVFSADEKSNFEKQQGALDEAVESVRSMNVNYPEKPK